MRTAHTDGFILMRFLSVSPCWDAATCSLGLVLPPYNEYYIQADLSDVMVQLQCEYREAELSHFCFIKMQHKDEMKKTNITLCLCYRYAVIAPQLL